MIVFRLMLLLSLCAGLARAEPGVAVILDSRQPGQSELSARARRFVYVLIKQNQLANYQFSLKTVDLATPEGREFQREFRLTGRDVPALGYYQREGNRLHLRNLVRAYRNPQEAAEDMFRCAQVEAPELITSTSVFTGASLESQPVGARVLEGEAELGVTPCHVNLTPGRHQLTLSHPDCLPETVTLNLKAGDHPVQTLQLTPCPSQLTIESAGQPLEVNLDGQPLGPTPVTIPTVAGSHRLQATAEGVFPLQVDLRAEPNRRMLAVLQPSPRRVRVGWAGLEAEGYRYRRTAYAYPTVSLGYGWGRRGCGNWGGWGSRYGYYGIPYMVEESVQLSAFDLTEQAEEQLTRSDRFTLVEGGRSADCLMRYQVQALQGEVVGELSLLDPKGETLQTFTARREMPWLTFDTEGSARKRAAEVVAELTLAAQEWIEQNLQPSALSPEDQAASVKVTELGPLP